MTSAETYTQIQFDPNHLGAELGFSVVFELLQILLISLLFKRYLWPRYKARFHAEIDAEHGIEHHEDHIHLKSAHSTKYHPKVRG